jgi:hypothetical protein
LLDFFVTVSLEAQDVNKEIQMKNIVMTVIIAALPLMANASDVSVNVDGLKIQTGNTTISFGDQDKRGYYWDGKYWRDPVYWEKNHGNGKGKGQGNGNHCPPGQAKKGNC